MAWHRITSAHRTQRHLEKASIREASSWIEYTQPIFETYNVIMLDYLARYDLSMDPKNRSRCIKSMNKLVEELEFSRGMLKLQAGLGNVMANSLLQRTLKAISVATRLREVCEKKDFAAKKWSNKFNLFEDFKKVALYEIQSILDLFEEKIIEHARRPVLKVLHKNFVNEITAGIGRFEAKHN